MRRIIGLGLPGLLLLSGCGNAVGDVHLSGLTGLTKSGDGHLVVVAYVCRDTIDRISVVRDREGLAADQENPKVASFKASAPFKGLVRFDLADHRDGWSPATPLTLDPDRGYLFTAEGLGDDSGEASTTWLGPGRLDTIKAGTISTSDDDGQPTLTARTPQEFVDAAKTACTS